MKGYRVGIVGGNGKMGQWFARFFRENQLPVAISDFGTKLSNQELVESSDIVVISVPIGSTVEVIESLQPFFRSDQLLVDLTSIKKPALEAMLESEAEVLGLHPMFGPQVDCASGQTMIVCRARPVVIAADLEQLFRENGLTICYSTAQEHDQIMAVIQGLNHFAAIAAAESFRRLGVDLVKTLSYSSPIYRMHLAMIGRIMAQDPRLYGEIEILNPEAATSIKTFLESAGQLATIVSNKDLDGFADFFKEAASYFGDYTEIAMRESNAVVRALKVGP